MPKKRSCDRKRDIGAHKKDADVAKRMARYKKKTISMPKTRIQNLDATKEISIPKKRSKHLDAKKKTSRYQLKESPIFKFRGSPTKRPNLASIQGWGLGV